MERVVYPWIELEACPVCVCPREKKFFAVSADSEAPGNVVACATSCSGDQYAFQVGYLGWARLFSRELISKGTSRPVLGIRLGSLMGCADETTRPYSPISDRCRCLSVAGTR